MSTDHSLAELAALAGVAPRTIRFYIAQGLLPSPGRDGPGSRYPASTLHRLRLIRQLQRGHLPLAEIRRRLEALSDDEIEALAGAPSDEPPPDSALDYVRSVLAKTTPSPLAPASLPSPPATATARAAPLYRAAPALLALQAPTVPPPPAPTVPPPPAPTVPPPPAAPLSGPSTAALERSQWDRIVLEPDVELHVRRPLSRIANKRVERLIAFARQLLEEDQP